MTVVDEINHTVRQLTPAQQQAVLSFARALQPTPTSALPPGARLSDLLQFAGSIPSEELKQMERAIEDGCERVNADAW
jgi:hypothetical protein